MVMLSRSIMCRHCSDMLFMINNPFYVYHKDKNMIKNYKSNSKITDLKSPFHLVFIVLVRFTSRLCKEIKAAVLYEHTRTSYSNSWLKPSFAVKYCDWMYRYKSLWSLGTDPHNNTAEQISDNGESNMSGFQCQAHGKHSEPTFRLLRETWALLGKLILSKLERAVSVFNSTVFPNKEGNSGVL